MKRYKVSEVLKKLREDGWYQVSQRGSHRQFKHPYKKGRVTIEQNILNSIWKQAGWR